MHGPDLKVRRRWSPLFDRYGVDLVLAGHDHDYQRSEPIDGVTYVVSGAGAKVRPTARAAFTDFSAATLHYLDLWITAERIRGKAINSNGKAFDEFTISDSR